MYLNTPLMFSSHNIENFSDVDLPMVSYRYFNNIVDRNNFLKGNVWFCGPSKNRFFSDESDQWEYRNLFGSFLWEYSLSCSQEILDKNKSNIKITNTRLFIEEIIKAIKSNDITANKVSWFPKEALMAYSSIIPSVHSIKEYPKKEDEKIELYIVGVGGRKVEYVDKMTPESKGIKYDGVEVARNARNQNDEFDGEGEIRFHINTGDFLGPYHGNCLMHLVQYVKIFCPGIKRYCKVGLAF